MPFTYIYSTGLFIDKKRDFITFINLIINTHNKSQIKYVYLTIFL